MAKFTIYSKDGSKVRCEGEPQYSGSYMSVDYLEFRTISSPHPIDWERGDYVDYFRTGMRYKLYSHPMPKKVARRGEYGGAIEYSNVQFFGATKELEIAPFRDIVPEDNTIHFSTRPDVSTYENVYGIARRIQECVNDIFPNRWRIEVYDTDDADLLALLNETKEYTVSNGSCLDALSQIYDTWKNVGWIHTYDAANDIDVITIGRANVRDAENTSDSFSYGIGNGLTSIKKAAANEGEFATRLYVYGSERNIQTRYYNSKNILNKDSVDIRNLMLPLNEWGKTNGLPDARKAYLEADASIVEKYGLIPRTVYFDGSQNEEIYPSITGLTMAEVREKMINSGEENSPFLPADYDYRIDEVGSLLSELDNGTKEETESQRTVDICLREMGFNIVEQGRLTAEGYATIAMKSGACAGREFKVTKYLGKAYAGSLYGNRMYRIEKNWDESLGEAFPNVNYPIKTGDQFVLLDIPMPNFYITLAEDRLLAAGKKMLADYTRVSAFYEPGINPIKIKEGRKLLRAGMYMQVYDEDIIDTEDNTDYVLIDTLTIDEKAELPQYKVTLREQKRSARTFSALEDMIVDAKESTQKEVAKARQYTDRRFNSAQETISMLAEAFEGYSEGISPITVKTMAMLVGDESNQFKFTDSLDSLDDENCPLRYDNEAKQMVSESVSYIKHMTLGIDAVTTGDARGAGDYKGWEISPFYSEILEDTEARYIYIKASKSDETAEFVLSKSAIGMESVDGYYYFVVGILNSEYNGSRDFVTLYGFTEVLPGQITTDVIRSSSGNLIIDLVNAIIEAKNGATIRGSVKIEEGSFMSSRMDVVDPDTEEVEAFFNGGDFAKDTDVDPHTNEPCGKLILAAGIPNDDRALEERAREATTRIYEDGCTYTKNLHLQDGCTVGDLNITDGGGGRIYCGDGNFYGTENPNEVQYAGFSKSGIRTTGYSRHGKTQTVVLENDCNGRAMLITVGTSWMYCRGPKGDDLNPPDAGLEINAPNAYGICMTAGVFAGLRPNTRTISTSKTLTNEDHTILCNTSDITIYLPVPAQKGQMYRFLRPNARGRIMQEDWANMIVISARGEIFEAAQLPDGQDWSGRIVEAYWNEDENRYWVYCFHDTRTYVVKE